MLKKITNYLLALFLFFLPWQTRWIYAPAELNGGQWEYGSLCYYGTELLLWLIILLFVANILREWKNRPPLTPMESGQRAVLTLGGLGVLLFAGFLIWHSLSSDISYQFVLRLLSGFCLVVILRLLTLNTKHSLSRCFNRDPDLPCRQAGIASGPTASLWFAGVLQGALAIYQFFTQTVWENKWLGMASQSAKIPGTSVVEFGDERWLRAYGSFGSPNSLGIFLAVIFILGIIFSSCGGSPAGRYFKTDSKVRKVLVLIGQILILSGLILSFSRGSWLAALVGLIVMVIIVWRNKEKRFELAKQIFFYILIFSFFFFTLHPLFSARANFKNRLETISISERVNQVGDWQKVFSRHPFFGVGPGVYTLALYKENPSQAPWQYQPIHNIYLLALSEMGGLAFLLLAMVVSYFLRKIIRLRSLYLAPLAVIFTAGLFDHWLWSMWTGLALMFVIFGLTLRKEQ